MPKSTQNPRSASGGPLAAWTLETDSLPERGREVKRTATADELQALAEALEIPSVESLSAKIYAVSVGDRHFRVTGALDAAVVQSCVVTLEPIRNSVSAQFSAEFRPAGEVPDEDGVIDLDDATEIEPLAGAAIDFGRVVFEELAAALDPYPRKPGAVFKPGTGPKAAKPESPFAVLAQLKAKEKK